MIKQNGKNQESDTKGFKETDKNNENHEVLTRLHRHGAIFKEITFRCPFVGCNFYSDSFIIIEKHLKEFHKLKKACVVR